MWGQRLHYICSEQNTLSAANKLDCNKWSHSAATQFCTDIPAGTVAYWCMLLLELTLLSTSFFRLMIFNYCLVDLCILPGEVQKTSSLPSIPHYILQITLLYPPLCCLQPSLPFKSLLVLSKLSIPHFSMNIFFLQGQVVIIRDMQLYESLSKRLQD